MLFPPSPASAAATSLGGSRDSRKRIDPERIGTLHLDGPNQSAVGKRDFWPHLEQGLYDEAALQQTWMGDGEPGQIDLRRVENKQIEIERS